MALETMVDAMRTVVEDPVNCLHWLETELLMRNTLKVNQAKDEFMKKHIAGELHLETDRFIELSGWALHQEIRRQLEALGYSVTGEAGVSDVLMKDATGKEQNPGEEVGCADSAV